MILPFERCCRCKWFDHETHDCGLDTCIYASDEYLCMDGPEDERYEIARELEDTYGKK